jgi:hypothetical protein
MALLLALDECQWGHRPGNMAPNVIALEGFSLKHRIARFLATRDPAVIEKVLRIDLGYQYPPLIDFIARDSFEEELHLIERSGLGGGPS